MHHSFSVTSSRVLFIGKTRSSLRHHHGAACVDRAQHFVEFDPDLQAQDFTLDMFTVEGIEVLESPVGIDVYIKNFVVENSDSQ